MNIGALSYAGPALYGLQRGEDDQTKLNEQMADSRQARTIRQQQADEQAALAPVRRRALEATTAGAEAATAESAALAPPRRQSTQAQLDASQIGLDEAKAQQQAAKNQRMGMSAIQKFRASGNDPSHIADYFNTVNKDLGMPDVGWKAEKDARTGNYVFTDSNGKTINFGQEKWPDGRTMSPEDNLQFHVHATANPQALMQTHDATLKFHQKMAEDAQKQANQMALELAKLKTPGKTPQEVRLSLIENMGKNNPLWATLPQAKRDEILNNALSFVQTGGSAQTQAAGNSPPSEIEGAKVTNDPKLGWIATKDGKTYRVNPPAKAAPAAVAAPAPRAPAAAPAALPTYTPPPEASQGAVGPAGLPWGDQPQTTALPTAGPAQEVDLPAARAARAKAEADVAAYSARRIRSDPTGFAAAKTALEAAKIAEAQAAKSARQAEVEAGGGAARNFRTYADGGAINPRVSHLDEQIKTARVRGDKETVARLTRQRQTVAAL